MKQMITRAVSAMLAVVLALAAAPLPAAAADVTAVTGYKLTNAAGVTMINIKKDTILNLELTLKNPGVKTKDVSADKLDVSRLVDSFSGGTPVVTITSAGEDPLAFTVLWKDVKYSGSGKAFRCMVGIKGSGQPYETVEANISEAIEYEAPKPTDPPPFTPEAIPMPMMLLSRDQVSVIEAGQTRTVTLTIQNLGTTTMRSPVVTVTPSDSLMLEGGSSSFTLKDIARGKSETLTVTVRATDVIASAAQSLGVEVKFNYDNGTALTQGSVSDKVSIPAKVKAKENIAAPTVIVTRSAIKDAIKAGQEFSVNLTFKNAGKTALETPVVSISTSEGLLLLDDTSTHVLDNIAPGASKTLTVRLKGAAEIASVTQSVMAELKYNYYTGETTAQGTASEKVNVTAKTTTQQAGPEKPVPNLIITKFTYGNSSVAAGDKFTLGFTFSNTSALLAVENVVLTLETGENFTMDASTNTFYYKRLGPGGVQTQEVPMQSVPAAKTGAQSVDVTFKYEYVDGNKRASGTSTVKVSIPIYQPDRFQITPPVVPETATMGEELSLTLAYVNKGKSEVSNVEAIVDGEIGTLVKTQNLGNFEPGKSGNIGFAVTPEAAGEVSFTLRVSYEDANRQVKTRDFPVTLNVSEPVMPEPEMPVDPEPQGGSHTWMWYAGGGVLGLGLVLTIVIVKKKKRAGQAASTFTWDEEEEPAAVSASAKEE